MKKTLKLDPLLREILINKEVHQFTVTELRDISWTYISGLQVKK